MNGYAPVKRAFDLITALAMALALLPVFVVVAVLIRATSDGPAIFCQARVGRHGRPFRMFKFRTMRTGPDSAAVHNEDRVTPVGRALRRYRIDELPQVLNIIRGEMSWIGPRPEAETLSAIYAANLPGYHDRHAILPGVTGWAQVNQGHVIGIDQAATKLALDRYYVARRSPWMDMLIVAKTVSVLLSGAGR